MSRKKLFIGIGLALVAGVAAAGVWLARNFVSHGSPYDEPLGADEAKPDMPFGGGYPEGPES